MIAVLYGDVGALTLLVLLGPLSTLVDGVPKSRPLFSFDIKSEEKFFTDENFLLDFLFVASKYRSDDLFNIALDF